MHRFFADERGIVENIAYLNAEDAGHALRVLRLENGDEVELVCAPARYLAEIDSTEGGEVRLRVTEKLRDTEAQTRVTLYQGLPKADKMECVVKLEGKDAAKKTERWQKIAREAVKQCARVNAPEVKMPRKLAAMKDELNALDVLIVPWEDARDGSIADCLAPFKAKERVSIGILIGPEGGIAPEEAEWLTHEAGAKLVTLGPRILRTETAAIASQTIVMALRGEME